MGVVTDVIVRASKVYEKQKEDKVVQWQSLDLTFRGCPTVSYTLFRSESMPFFPDTGGASALMSVILDSDSDRLVLRHDGKIKKAASVLDRIAFGHELLMFEVFAEPAVHFAAGQRGGVDRPEGYRQVVHVLDSKMDLSGLRSTLYIGDDQSTLREPLPTGVYRASAVIDVYRRRLADGSRGLANLRLRFPGDFSPVDIQGAA